MTIDEFAASVADKTMLTPADVQKVTGVHPSNTVAYAREGKLPYPYMLSGSHVKIPKGAFLAWWRGDLKTDSQDGFGRYRIEFRADELGDLIEQIRGYLKAFEYEKS